MKIFDVEDGLVRLTTESLLIPEIKAVVKKYKDKHLDVIAYCEFLKNPNSPYSNLQEDEKDAMLKDAYLSKHNIGSYEIPIVELCEFLTTVYVTPVVRLFRAAVILSDKVSQWAETVNVTDANDVKQAREYLTKMPEMLKSLKAAIKEKDEESSRARGNKKVSYDQG